MSDKTYTYEGPVLNQFGHLLDLHWYAQTLANSQSKARSNLMYRYKKENNMALHCRIDLPGKFTFEKES